MEALRREVFTRDYYRCQHVTGYVAGIPWHCYKPVTWETGHLAHIISRGRGGPDTAENCLTKCAHCHLVLEHQQGGNGKIVPRKEV